MIEDSKPSIAHDSGTIQSIALEGKEWVPAQNPAVVEEKIKAEAAKEMKKLVKPIEPSFTFKETKFAKHYNVKDE